MMKNVSVDVLLRFYFTALKYSSTEFSVIAGNGHLNS